MSPIVCNRNIDEKPVVPVEQYVKDIGIKVSLEAFATLQTVLQLY